MHYQVLPLIRSHLQYSTDPASPQPLFPPHIRSRLHTGTAQSAAAAAAAHAPWESSPADGCRAAPESEHTPIRLPESGWRRKGARRSDRAVHTATLYKIEQLALQHPLLRSLLFWRWSAKRRRRARSQDVDRAWTLPGNGHGCAVKAGEIILLWFVAGKEWWCKLLPESSRLFPLQHSECWRRQVERRKSPIPVNRAL